NIFLFSYGAVRFHVRRCLPPRRASDLARGVGFVANRGRVWRGFPQSGQRSAAMIDQFRAESRRTGTESRQCGQFLSGINQNFDRSEEHTSELQSRENLVCRLLLEKKNK